MPSWTSVCVKVLDPTWRGREMKRVNLIAKGWSSSGPPRNCLLLHWACPGEKPSTDFWTAVNLGLRDGGVVAHFFSYLKYLFPTNLQLFLCVLPAVGIRSSPSCCILTTSHQPRMDMLTLSVQASPSINKRAGISWWIPQFNPLNSAFKYLTRVPISWKCLAQTFSTCLWMIRHKTSAPCLYLSPRCLVRNIGVFHIFTHRSKNQHEKTWDLGRISKLSVVTQKEPIESLHINNRVSDLPT